MPLTREEMLYVLDGLNARYRETHVVTYVEGLPAVDAWLALPRRAADMNLMVSANDPAALVERLDEKVQDPPTVAFPAVGRRPVAYGAWGAARTQCGRSG